MASHGKLNPCRWCGNRNRTPSEWEQRNLSGIWQRLCVRCAERRLDNPWNALLDMRKAGSGVEETLAEDSKPVTGTVTYVSGAPDPGQPRDHVF